MPKAEAGSAKAIGNAIKAKGLGRLRWFCQVCQKQCRDENGFKMHSQSEGHLRQMLVVGESAGKYIDDFSKGFLDDFLALLSRRYNTQRTRANQVYNEYIQDKTHLHMNATKWVTLTEFVKYIGREGLVRADEDDKGWWISWVDTSPKALARQAEAQKKERSEMDDEQRERRRLRDQIERAREREEEARRLGAGAGGVGEVGLARIEGLGKISLSFGGAGVGKVESEKSHPSEDGNAENATTNAEAGPGPSSVALAASASATPPAIQPPPSHIPITNAAIALSKVTLALPPKRPSPSMNVFKQPKTKPSSSSLSMVTPTASHTHSNSLADTIMDDDTRIKGLRGKRFLTAAERVMLEDMERKKRGGGGGGFQGVGYQGMGPSRGGR